MSTTFGKVMNLSETMDIEASEDIIDARGNKLLAKGSRVSRALQERLIVHKPQKAFGCMYIGRACGGGDNGVPTGTALYTTAPAGLIMTVKDTATFRAAGGTPKYSVTSNDVSIATVVIDGVNFTITAVKAGDVTMNVNDAAGATVAVPVTVKDKALPG